ncbi:4Fe-4S binding protein [uncultured Adlercreutzia sp.]|uniref:4Fe-4S binding protein n=1 Tax=uncultured Adlercreutzia sp. TaxID=875803 RepID=UPI0026759659|nr:4Fe-4S binding protein [uncultured Adlercreutzia sp.]
MAKKYEGKKLTPSFLRKCTLGLVFLLVVIGLLFNTGTGTLSSFGFDTIAAICPLGALESLFGTWAFVPRLIIALAAVVAIVLLVGRAFCAWVCPVPPVVGFFKTKKRREADDAERAAAGQAARACHEQGGCPSRSKAGIDSRHIVLCGALGSAAIFGFPVFCLVCPIGLTFAIMLGLIRLVGFNEPSWSLVLFAAILVLEVVFLRKWCAKICPVGALLSLISRANRTLRPQIDTAKCLRSHKGDTCGVCAVSCPEHIDPHSDKGLVALHECTRCGACAEACPEGAISFPLMPKKDGEAALNEDRAPASDLDEEPAGT